MRNEIRPVADLSAAEWDDLGARALDPHPFYGRRALAAHRGHGLAPADLAAVTVREGDRLAALLPFDLRRDVTGLGRAVARPFVSPYVTGTAPLVADGPGLDDRLGALVAGLARASGGRGWRWPLLSTEAPVGAALLRAMRAAGWSVATVAAFARPVLDRRPDHAAYLRDHPHRGRLKDLRRRRRRLGEAGLLVHASATGGAALDRAVEAFLALEAAGWKGGAGTALRSHARTEAFARALFAAGTGPVSVRADSLTLDGRPLAVSLALVAGRTAFLLKTAYDEAHRAHAPGLVLEAEIVRALHETGFADRLDSATLPGSALETLYGERETVAEIVALPPGAGPVPLELGVRLARLEHRARAGAKRLLRPR